jgi:hypothetical protein
MRCTVIASTAQQRAYYDLPMGHHYVSHSMVWDGYRRSSMGGARHTENDVRTTRLDNS